MLLTAGVDVQDDRLEVSVWGWGSGETGWLIWHQKLMGDPTQIEVWGQLDQVLRTQWDTEGANTLTIAQMAIDSGGHCTHEVYNYCRDRIKQGVVPIKGSSKRSSPALGKGSRVDVNWRGRTVKKGVTLYMLGTDTIKTTLFGRMRHSEGLSSLNFGLAADQEYFQQLTAERQRLRFHRGYPIREWVKKPSARNEALDCLVYGYAAMLLYSRRLPKLTMWENLAEKLEKGDNRQLKSKKQPPKAANSYVSSW